MWDPDSAEAEDERARAGLPASVGARRSLTRPILDRMVDPLTAARTSARTLDEDRQGDPRTIGLLRDSLATLNHMLNEAREDTPRSVEAGLQEAAQDILTSFARRPGWVLEHDSEEADALREALAASRSVETAGLDVETVALRAALRTVEDAIDATPDSDEWRAFMLVERAALSSAAPRPEGTVERLREAIRRHRDVQPTHEVEDKYHDIYEAAHRCDEDCAEAIAAVLAAPRSVETAASAAARACTCGGDDERPRGHISSCPLWKPYPASPAAPRPEGPTQRIYAAIRAAIVQPDANLDTAYVPWRAIKAAFMDAAAPRPEGLDGLRVTHIEGCPRCEHCQCAARLSDTEDTP